MRIDYRKARINGDRDFDISKRETPTSAGDLLATTPAIVAFVILGVTLAVDAILVFVSVLFAATILLIFVSFILWLVCGGITILFCGIGAIISLIGALCSVRRPVGLVANGIAFVLNTGAVGLAWWLMAELLDKFR